MADLILINILKFFLLLQVADTVISNCSNFEWENDVNSYTRCLVGEWSVIDCRVNNNDNVHATLWFNREKLTIDGERIKLISKNMFNITNLQLRDKGNYYCKACSQTKSLATINVKEGTAFAIPIITKRPAPETRVKYGSTVTLECSVTGSYNDYEMIWFKVMPNKRNVAQKSTIHSIWSSDFNKREQRKRLTIFNFNEESAEYYCRVKRYNVNHVGKATIQLHLEELAKPVISSFSRDGKLIVVEKNDRVMNFSVSGTPIPDVSWYKYVNGKEKEHITKCIGRTNTCSPTNIKDIEVTPKSFVIKNASYLRHDNVTYICRATNVKGHDESKFTMIVKTEPRLTPLKSKIRLHKENLHLHCNLSKFANPKNVSYSWAYFDQNVSDAESLPRQNKWTQLSAKSNTLKILSNQTGGIRLYRCATVNDIGTDQLIWIIVRPIGQNIPKPACAKLQGKDVHTAETAEKEKKSNNGRIEPIVIWQCIVAFLVILLLLTLVISLRRRSPPMQKCNTCFNPSLNLHTGCKV